MIQAKLRAWLITAGALASLLHSQAGVSFPDPAGGWSYIYSANAGQSLFGDGASFDALDGTWSHNNGSDQWDGSGLGGTFEAGVNSPGGAEILSENGISFLRIQDPGDPRDYTYSDPSNRKVYFGHDISADGATPNALDTGITLSFRARIPTPSKSTGPLDPLHRDGQGSAGPKPYPEGGDGYVTSDGGKGNFVVKQANGGAFAFSLAVADDQGQGDPNAPKAGFNGLTMNEFNGNVISGNVNFGQGTGTNVLALDPTEWHEFWIVLRKDPANVGTHEALIYVDGSTTAKFFKITAGSGDDYGGIGYIAMGSTATPQNSALDVDFFAFKTEAVFPPGAQANLPPEITDVTPARGAENQDATAGFSFRATTQPPNGIFSNGAILTLNGRNVSEDMEISGDLRNRQYRYTKLTPNTLYAGSIVVTDTAGRSTTNAVQFDTFVPGTLVQAEFTDYGQDVTVNLPEGPIQLVLKAGSTGSQWLRVERVDGPSPRAVGSFIVQPTGSRTTTAPFALTDIGGRTAILAGGAAGPATFRIRPQNGLVSTPAELLIVPSPTPATELYVASVTPHPGATGAGPDTMIRGDIVRASGAIPADAVSLLLDNRNVTASSVVTLSGNVTTITYRPSEFLAAGFHDAELGYPVSVPNAVGLADWQFAVPNLPRLKASWATAPASVDGKPRGFRGRIHVPRQDAPSELFPNSPERASSQLAGLIIDPETGSAFDNLAAGPSSDGSFIETDTINYEQSGSDESIPGDRPFPNTEPADHNYIALEAVTYLQLDRGTHRLGVACDDGFVVWSGPSAAATTNQVGIRSPGGGTVESNFDFVAEASGVYAFRLMFFEGNGSADVEWYSVNLDTGGRTLLNASTETAAWQSRNGDGTDTAPVPTLSATTESNGDLILTYTGTLQSSGNLNGSFNAVPGASSPYRIAKADQQTRQFYRASN